MCYSSKFPGEKSFASNPWTVSISPAPLSPASASRQPNPCSGDQHLHAKPELSCNADFGLIASVTGCSFRSHPPNLPTFHPPSTYPFNNPSEEPPVSLSGAWQVLWPAWFKVTTKIVFLWRILGWKYSSKFPSKKGWCEASCSRVI